MRLSARIALSSLLAVRDRRRGQRTRHRLAGRPAAERRWAIPARGRRGQQPDLGASDQAERKPRGGGGKPRSLRGNEPVSIAVHEDIVYVANAGDGGNNYTGFTLNRGGHLRPLPDSTFSLPDGLALLRSPTLSRCIFRERVGRRPTRISGGGRRIRTETAGPAARGDKRRAPAADTEAARFLIPSDARSVGRSTIPRSFTGGNPQTHEFAAQSGRPRSPASAVSRRHTARASSGARLMLRGDCAKLGSDWKTH